ncbi:MAG: diaminopimelate epimerase [Xanthomonadaceae bacterium]|nr:diaminopimelate epimerase [Xanthomonadaceae bacterium]
MSAAIHFEKWQALGNDFILIDQAKNPSLKLNADLARKLCDRHYGIGADQILHLTLPMSPLALGRMDLRNADGETSEMCGNGIRAVALYFAEKHPGRKEIPIEVMSRVYPITLTSKGARVDMGAPQVLNLSQSVDKISFTEVNMGNPHAVIELDSHKDLTDLNITTLGPQIELNSRFPNRTNVEWAWVENRKNIHMCVWERGAGVTLACGSGACAVVAAMVAEKKCDAQVSVHLPGGMLSIEWSGAQSDSVWMEGPASRVFVGEWK